MSSDSEQPVSPRPEAKPFVLFLKVAGSWLGGIVLLIAACLIYSWFHDRAPANAPMIETLAADEQYYTSRIVASTIRAELAHRAELLRGNQPVATTAASAPGYKASDYRRDVHAKTHGCVNAHVTVDDQFDSRFRFGVFSEPGKSWRAIVRFSSGKPDLEPDSERDVRGMAVKLLDVPGPKLLDFDEGGTTQDFLATTSPVFFIRTVDQYDAFSAAFSEDRIADYFFPLWYDPRGWHVRQLVLMLEGFRSRPSSLVTESYYSGSAYRLGPVDHVKFKFQPCAKNAPIPPAANSPAYDYLRYELANQASKGAACFDLMVQRQLVDKNMPIEDTTVEWSEKDSPFAKVATIAFDAGANNTEEMNRRCESLTFNPWHALADHRPVGVMNRLRQAVYQQMSAFRRTKNCEALCARSCSADANGNRCGGGCKDACMAACPLLQDPVPASLSVPGTCGVQAAGPVSAQR